MTEKASPEAIGCVSLEVESEMLGGVISRCTPPGFRAVSHAATTARMAPMADTNCIRRTACIRSPGSVTRPPALGAVE